jgi:hypothetical protein
MIGAVRATRAALLGALGVALPVGVAAAIAIARHPRIVVGGDTAFVEEAVAQAEHGRQLLGSVDRFGVAHLGPAHYYLLAPVYWLLGNTAYALAVGSLALVGVAAAAIVVLGRRRGGAALALSSALLVLLYLHSIGAERLRDPWGPWAIMVPTLLFLVLAAAWASGSAAALPGAVAVGSFRPTSAPRRRWSGCSSSPGWCAAPWRAGARPGPPRATGAGTGSSPAASGRSWSSSGFRPRSSS